MDARLRSNLIWLVVFIALDIYNFTLGLGPSMLSWLGVVATVVFTVLVFLEYTKSRK